MYNLKQITIKSYSKLVWIRW